MVTVCPPTLIPRRKATYLVMEAGALRTWRSDRRRLSAGAGAAWGVSASGTSGAAVPIASRASITAWMSTSRVEAPATTPASCRPSNQAGRSSAAVTTW